MEKKRRPLSTYNERNFDFYETRWIIEDFLLASCSKNWTFQSPEFTIRGCCTTKWLMTLRGAHQCSNIQLTLKRSDSDAGPDEMWVDWRIKIFAENYEHRCKWRIGTFCCFQRGTECREDLESEGSYLDMLEPFKPDSLTVRCEFICYDKNASKEYPPCGNMDVRCLSENLFHLYLTRIDTDLEFRFKTKADIILAHKVIVCSRIRLLNYLLEHEGYCADGSSAAECNVLDLSYLDYNGMKKVLQYAYSGDLRHVLEEPSLALYDCVRELDMSELKPYFTPNKLLFRSAAESNEITFKWFVGSIEELMCNSIATSPVLTDDHFGTTWRLHIRYLREGITGYFGIHAEGVQEIEPMHLCIEVAVIDKGGHFVHSMANRCSNVTDPSKTYGFYRFTSVSTARNVSHDDRLGVVARLRISDGSYTSLTDMRHMSYATCIPADQSYSSLSLDMGFAFESGYFSDLNIRYNGVVYTTHKCILVARCGDMYVRVCGTHEHFPDVEKAILLRSLEYVYTGVNKHKECGDHCLKLYKAAVELHLQTLKDNCFKCFVYLLRHDRVVRERALLFAERSNNEALTKAITRCVSGV